MEFIKLTPDKFAVEIETIVRHRRLNYIDAVTFFCSCRGLDVLDITPFINSVIKYKIRLDAERLNLIKATSKLPI